MIKRALWVVGLTSVLMGQAGAVDEAARVSQLSSAAAAGDAKSQFTLGWQ
jgi:hypothetical protein